MTLWQKLFGHVERDDSEQRARTANVLERLAFARAEMRRRGTRTLLDGRPAWQRINPMAVQPEPTKVVTFKRRGK